jgi:cysteine-rich repeat protein
MLLALAGPARAVNPGEVVVADYPAVPNPSRILKFNAAGALIGTFADTGDGLEAPRDMAFDAAGNLYVADNAAVLILDANGNNVGSITTGLTKAESVAFKSNGEIFVSNRISAGSSEIKRYSAAGALLQTWVIPEFDSGGAKPFAREIVFGPNGLLYLCLRGSSTSSNDNLLATLNTSTNTFAAFAAAAQQVTQPIGVVFEPAGTLLVSNDTGTQSTQTSRIVRLSAAGTFLAEYWNQGAARDLVFDGFGQLHGANRSGGVFLWNASGGLRKEYGTGSLLAPISVALRPASAPYCQNEILESGEQCDDGNFTPCDGCSAACVTEFGCGDGSRCGAEQCDDGNGTTCDGCSAACVTETCGDGVICAGLGENCDDSNTTACDGCSPACRTEVCGNGKLDCNEECDDANAGTCDGCTGCKVDELAYREKFESGSIDWNATGLWNEDTNRIVSPTHSWYYGMTSSRTYQTFFPPENSGNLTSPPIDLTQVSGATLQFGYFLETENHPGVDVTSVQVSRDNFVSDVTTLESPLPEQGAMAARSYSLSAFSGDTIQVRFGFDTVDGNANTFEGFYVDDVTVRGSGAPVCGNGMAAHACGEGCDDGNLANFDGCSGVCQAEGVTSQGTFTGTGQGGAIHITVNGVALVVTTFAGDSAATVASRVAGAINGNATLQGQGVSATWVGSRLDVIAGTISSLSSTDPGIHASQGAGIPTLSPASAWILALGLLALGGRRLTRPRRSRAD